MKRTATNNKTDATEAQIGLRYQKQRSSTDSGLTASAGGTTYTNLSQQFDAVDEAVTGSASLSHQVSDDVRIYANYGRSFRPSGRLPVPANPPLEAGTWDPETSDSLELGFKSRFNDGRIQLNGDVFYQKFHDFIARASYIWTNNCQAGALSNTYGFNYSADVVVQGAEMSLDALRTDNWKLGASFSYTDARFDNAAKPCNVFTPADKPVLPTSANAAAYGVGLGSTGEYFAGNSSGRLGTEANWMASLTSEYAWPLGMYEPFVRGLFNFRSGRAEDTVRNGDTPRYGVFNLYAGVHNRDNGWEVSLWAKNLFDRKATTAITATIQQSQILGNPIATGYYSVQVIPEREVGITGSYNF